MKCRRPALAGARPAAVSTETVKPTEKPLTDEWNRRSGALLMETGNMTIAAECRKAEPVLATDALHAQLI
jgi:hypothetical protein